MISSKRNSICEEFGFFFFLFFSQFFFFFRLVLLDSFVAWKTEQETFVEKLNSYVAVLEHLFLGNASSEAMNLSLQMLEMLLIGVLQNLHGYPSLAAGNFARALVASESAWKKLLSWKPVRVVSCPVVYIASEKSENGFYDWKPFCSSEIKVLFSDASHINIQAASVKFLLNL